MTEILIKVQTFFELCEKSAGWMDIIYKITYGVKCIDTTKNNPGVRYLHAADVRYHLDCRLVQACLPGAIVTTILLLFWFVASATDSTDGWILL